MKIFKFILSLSLLSMVFIGCEKDPNGTDFVNDFVAPSDISVLVEITQDNTGLVTLTPLGKGVGTYRIDFGDNSDSADGIAPGSSVDHVYEEGTYEATIIGVGLNGKTSEAKQTIVVSFKAPENLNVTVNKKAGDPFTIEVSATADFTTAFDVYFGDVSNEEASPLMVDETIEHTYAETGAYELRVIAKNGGSGTLEHMETVVISNPLLLPIDFENASLTYTFVDFGNVVSNTIANPDPSGINTSNTVGQSLKPTGSETWAGTFIQVDEAIDFSQLKNLSVDVWSPKADITVMMKVENATDTDVFVEVPLQTTTSNEWERLTYDFSAVDLNAEYHKVVLFFDFNVSGTDETYYFDNIQLAQSTNLTYELFEDFEGAAPTFTVFGNIDDTEVIMNPQPNAVNMTTNSAKLFKNSGSEVWAGTFFELQNKVISFQGDKSMQFKSFAPKAGVVVKLKIENDDASITHEVDVTNTKANEWELLTYDFSGAPVAEYNRVVVFYDFGNAGEGVDFYFDEMEISEGAIKSTLAGEIVEDFEGEAPSFTVFGNIASVDIVANPSSAGSNASAQTASFVKPSNSEVWAGVFFEIMEPLDLANFSKIKLSSFSPETGRVIKLKLENLDASITHEVDIISSISNEWEDLVYDFSAAPMADYIRIVVFYDFGEAGNDSTYYFDQIELMN